MRILFWFSVLLGSAQALACDELLSSRLPQIYANQLRIERLAARDLRMMGLNVNKLKTFIDTNAVFALRQSTHVLRTIVFEPNPSKADRGIMLTGFDAGENFVVTRAEWSHRDDELDYFRAVARRHRLEQVQVPLARNILNCPMLRVDGWVQAKLWLKHRLDLKAIAKFINFTRALPVEDPRHSSRGGNPRYVIDGWDGLKRHLAVVVGVDGNCPNVLITAFEIN